MWADKRVCLEQSYFNSLNERYDLMRYILLISLASISYVSYGQTDVDKINREIKFVNESIHGALILHRIYESYNQDINKYLDLSNYELNNYYNQGLPTDVYGDPERWFYDESPNKLYQEIITNQSTLMGQSIIQSIHRNSQNLNKDRYAVEQLIQAPNINELSIIKNLYDGLEQIISYFDNLRSDVKSFDKILEQRRYENNLTENQSTVYAAMAEIHYDLKKIIRTLSQNNQSAVMRSMAKIKKEQNWLNASINDLEFTEEREALIKIVGNVNNIVAELSNYIDKPKVPKEYALFGKGYYYYNVVLLTLMNRYGNGYVSEFNQFIDRFNWSALHLTEEPHYLKILYSETTPRKFLNQPQKEITTLEQLRRKPLEQQIPKPKSVDNFFNGKKTEEENKKIEVDIPVNIAHTHVIYVDSIHFNIELYDHLIIDGDIVSVNVNGAWMYNDISLEKEAKIIELTVNPSSRNFIMVQAVNEGWRPPNTVGLRYMSNGKVENIILKTDLKLAELIEIKYRQ